MMCWSILIVLGAYVVNRLEPDATPVSLANGARVEDTPSSVVAHLILEDAGLQSGAPECDVVAQRILAPQLTRKQSATVTREQLKSCLEQPDRTAAVA